MLNRIHQQLKLLNTEIKRIMGKTGSEHLSPCYDIYWTAPEGFSCALWADYTNSFCYSDYKQILYLYTFIKYYWQQFWLNNKC